MGYFFRRSAKFGLFHLNFSKSGVSASVGVKGARLTVTPRGATYITVGSRGFYYRETISNRSDATFRGAVPSAPEPPIATHLSDEIVTADVSDLADSSVEALIQRLNQRARMFNPAWIMYVAALGVSIGALAIFSSATDRDLPDVTSPLSTERKSNTGDDYSALVTRYGYPDLVLATEPLGVVPVRTARYSSAHARVVFVPNGCVGAYEEVMRTLDERARYPALAKRQIQNTKRCVASPNNSWTIVAYRGFPGR